MRYSEYQGSGIFVYKLTMIYFNLLKLARITGCHMFMVLYTNVEIKRVKVPPLTQGFGEHSSIFTPHWEPEKPARH